MQPSLALEEVPMIPKKQAGTHTWDLYVRYHRCPKCGYIIESRDDYQYQMGNYVKELTCNRCKNTFTESMPSTKHLGPIIGKPTTPEFDWSGS